MQQSHSTKRKRIAKFITANWSTIIDRNDLSKDSKLFLATIDINRIVDDEVMAIFEPNKYQVFTAGDIIKRQWNLACNCPTELQNMLTYNTKVRD